VRLDSTESYILSSSVQYCIWDVGYILSIIALWMQMKLWLKNCHSSTKVGGVRSREKMICNAWVRVLFIFYFFKGELDF